MSCATRKSQIRLELLLLSLISISKKTSKDIEFVENINSNLYYKTFRYILKRELTTITRFAIALTRLDSFEEFYQVKIKYYVCEFSNSTILSHYIEHYNRLFKIIFDYRRQTKYTLLYI